MIPRTASLGMQDAAALRFSLDFAMPEFTDPIRPSPAAALLPSLLDDDEEHVLGLTREGAVAVLDGVLTYDGAPPVEHVERPVLLLGVPAARCLAIEDSPTGALAAERAGCAVLVVPCEIPVPDGPGRRFRDSLVGLTLADLAPAVLQGS